MSTFMISILAAVFASTGFWALVTAIYEAKHKDKSAVAEMLLGLGHDRIYELCSEYLRKGEITRSEYDNLKHLYDPYTKLGGNGTASKLMKEIEDLPFAE